MAQLTPQEVQELVKLYKILDGLSDAAAQNAAMQAQAIGNAANELNRLRKEYKDWTGDITAALETFKDITSELNKQRTGINESKKAYTVLSSIAEKLQNHQKGIQYQSAKELEVLQIMANEEKQRLINAQKTLLNDKASLESKQQQLTAAIQQRAQQGLLANDLRKQFSENKTRLDLIAKIYQENKDTIDGTNTSLNQVLETLEAELVIQKQIEKSMGLTGVLIKGISKIPFLGDLPGMSNVLKAVEGNIRRIQEETGRTVTRAEALAIGFREISGVLVGALIDPLFLGGLLLKKMLDGFKELDKAQAEFTRETGKSVDHIDTLNMGLTTSAQYIKQATALTKQFGINAAAIFTPETLQEATEMVELMGVGADEAGRLARFSKLNGKELKSVNENIVNQVNNFNKANKTGINQKQVLEAVAKTSDHIAMTFGGNPEKIAKAVSEAKKLGLSLEQVDKIAESLLNFEESISAELEAELLTGKQINLDQARYYALTNDLNGLTKEIGNNQEVISVFTTGNRIQQDAIAKSMGLSRDEMAQMIFDQRMINGLSDKQLEKVTGMSAEDMKRLSVQESINNSIQKMSEALAGPLEMFAQLISNAGILYSLMGLIAGVIGLQLVTGLASMGKQLIVAIPRLATILGLEEGIAAAKISGAMGATVGLGAVAIIGGIAMGIAALMSAVNKAKTPGLAKGGTVIGEGSVLVGENGPEVLSMKPGATVTPLSKVNAATESGTGVSVSIKAGNTIIQLDGAVMAKAITPYVVEEMRKTSVQIQ